MRLREIFSGYDQLFNEDYDGAISIANQAMVSAKRQKKQAEISKAKDGVAKKQKQLSDLNKPLSQNK